MRSWRKLFVIGTLKQFSSKDFMSKHHVVFAQKDAIKLEMICEHMRVPVKVLQLLAWKKKSYIIFLQIPSERSKRENFVSFFSKK